MSSAVPESFRSASLERAQPAAGAWLLGERVTDSDSAQEVVNPTDGSVLLEFAGASLGDLAAAMPGIGRAAKEWGALGWGERLRHLQNFWAEVEAHAEELAVLDTLDAGLPVATTRGDVRQSLDAFQALVGWSLDAGGRTFPPTDRTMRALTLRQPYGVVAAIVPYNHPVKFALVKTAPALLAGNVVLLKPSDQTPLSAMVLGELAAKTLPPGVFNVVPGDHRIGEFLVEHEQIGRVSFTGSTSVGVRVARSLAGHMGTAHLELGGKNATVVLEDADLEAAARSALSGMDFARSSGQACWSLSRIFVAEAVADRFVELLVPLVEAITPGDPFDERCQMGPMSTVAGYDKFGGYRELAGAGGARLITAPADPALGAGLFRSPVVADVSDREHPVLTEEIFGPFLSIYRMAADEDPAELVNASPYGLTAAVWSRDLSRALALAERVEAGYVWVNSPSAKPPGLPFGAWKMSGYGKGMGAEEVLDWTREKAVIYSLT